MAYNSKNKIDNLFVLRRFFESIRIIPYDAEVCEVYGDLKAAFIQRFGPKEIRKRQSIKLHQLGVEDNDLWIAATAIRHGLTLVSSDSHFIRIREARGFPIESWLIMKEL